MPAPPLFDVTSLDLSRVVLSKDEVLALNPQRHEFEQLDAIAHLDLERGLAVAFKRQREDEFWVRGHIPGRPLMPGVMMIETAAQTCSVLYGKKFAEREGRFFGFGGVDRVKFRGAVRPGQTLVMVALATLLKPRLARFDTQGFVDGGMVFEGEITGVSL
jgi:3-hydroxyacyl-[acyl-carrier-protein] dehydratase